MKLLLFLVICPLSFLMLSAQSCSALNGSVSSSGETLTVLAYNLKNLFDAVDNGTEYPEFSVAKGKYTKAMYQQRLVNTSKVLLASDDAARGPDIALFEEVENKNVLDDLIKGPLRDYGYKASALVPAPGQSINCGIISKFPITEVHGHGLSNWGFSGRYILEIHLDVKGHPLIIFANHWKSKLGGAGPTEDERRAAAAQLALLTQALEQKDPEQDFFAVGDFNESPDEYERAGRSYQTAFFPIDEDRSKYGNKFEGLLLTSKTSEAGISSDGKVVMYSPWASSNKFSFSYQKSKDRIDGFLLPPSMLDNKGWSYSSFDVLDLDFLMKANGELNSWSTYNQTGYSDHLPIIMKLLLFS